MANKFHVIQNAALRGQALKRALELEFTNMRDRYFTPLPLGEDFLKEERRGAKRARGLEEAGDLSAPRSKRRFVEAIR